VCVNPVMQISPKPVFNSPFILSPLSSIWSFSLVIPLIFRLRQGGSEKFQPAPSAAVYWQDISLLPAPKNIYPEKNSEICEQIARGIEVKRTGRGERNSGHRGEEGSGGRGIRGSNDDQWDPDDPDQGTLQYPTDDEDDPSCTGSDEYIWPTIEDDPDD
jgi:hypothetical protein